MGDLLSFLLTSAYLRTHTIKVVLISFAYVDGHIESSRLDGALVQWVKVLGGKSDDWNLESWKPWKTWWHVSVILV